MNRKVTVRLTRTEIRHCIELLRVRVNLLPDESCEYVSEKVNDREVAEHLAARFGREITHEHVKRVRHEWYGKTAFEKEMVERQKFAKQQKERDKAAPVAAVVAAATPEPDLRKQLDELADYCARLTLMNSQLEKRIARLEQEWGVDEPVRVPAPVELAR